MSHGREMTRNADQFEVELPIGDNTIIAEVSVNYKDVEIISVWLTHPDCPDVRMPFEIDGLQTRRSTKFVFEPIEYLIEIAAHEALS